MRLNCLFGRWDKYGFLLTHLLRGATKQPQQNRQPEAISTHAPLARCDLGIVQPNDYCSHDFYSRTSCEVRLLRFLPASIPKMDFYSRTSCEVRPQCAHLVSTPANDFYSRTSCEVRRDFVDFCGRNDVNFYSRTSCEVRHQET